MQWCLLTQFNPKIFSTEKNGHQMLMKLNLCRHLQTLPPVTVLDVHQEEPNRGFQPAATEPRETLSDLVLLQYSH